MLLSVLSISCRVNMSDIHFRCVVLLQFQINGVFVHVVLFVSVCLGLADAFCC